MHLDKRGVRVMLIIVLCHTGNSVNKIVNAFQGIEFGFFHVRTMSYLVTEGALAITLIFYKTKMKVS